MIGYEYQNIWWKRNSENIFYLSRKKYFNIIQINILYILNLDLIIRIIILLFEIIYES